MEPCAPPSHPAKKPRRPTACPPPCLHHPPPRYLPHRTREQRPKTRRPLPLHNRKLAEDEPRLVRHAGPDFLPHPAKGQAAEPGSSQASDRMHKDLRVLTRKKTCKQTLRFHVLYKIARAICTPASRVWGTSKWRGGWCGRGAGRTLKQAIKHIISPFQSSHQELGEINVDQIYDPLGRF